jgi:hypothetical protein
MSWFSRATFSTSGIWVTRLSRASTLSQIGAGGGDTASATGNCIGASNILFFRAIFRNVRRATGNVDYLRVPLFSFPAFARPMSYRRMFPRARISSLSRPQVSRPLFARPVLSRPINLRRLCAISFAAGTCAADACAPDFSLSRRSRVRYLRCQFCPRPWFRSDILRDRYLRNP